MKNIFYFILWAASSHFNAQQTDNSNSSLKNTTTDHPMKYNELYQHGIADAFIGGLYKGTLSLRNLKLKGDFGLGAPDMLDGELTILDGQVYQTKATGQTVTPDDQFKSSLAFVTFFQPDHIFTLKNKVNYQKALQEISEVLPGTNTMFAIKITRKFTHMKTRAFPPVEKEPFPILTSIADRQKTFDFSNTEGTLVGFYLPEYLNGINIKGFHFHFISSDKKNGGHVLDFEGENLKTEIAPLESFRLETPKDKDFRNFQFETKNNESLELLEQGK
ncbi:acetolactate decarboxylase [Chryseobacterium oranimense]|uniref:Alpha-acetolactate decarboxylase n=1 Tax=Chryseobacterium oranimense TaxID=421058 RepID=A0A1M5R1Z9_9FLAO|nr:acetolactate decarboxylase [Chryseobacterium oranimense]SHH20427.1 acetolactate decarboxylase [Chryseobacterium oranimense]